MKTETKTKKAFRNCHLQDGIVTLSNNIDIYVYISYVFVHSRQLNSAKLIVLRKNPPLNRPSKHKPSWGLVLGISFKYKVKQSKNGKFTSNHLRLAQSILKHKFPSVDKPLRI